MHQTYTTLAELAPHYKDASFTGYLWYTSSEHPEKFHNQPIDFTALAKDKEAYNRIVEGQLYCNAQHTSIHLQCIDGTYHIHSFDVSQLEEADTFRVLPEKTVPSIKRLHPHNALKLRSLQQLTPSVGQPNCKAWQEVAQLFIGFTTENTPTP